MSSATPNNRSSTYWQQNQAYVPMGEDASLFTMPANYQVYQATPMQGAANTGSRIHLKVKRLPVLNKRTHQRSRRLAVKASVSLVCYLI